MNRQLVNGYRAKTDTPTNIYRDEKDAKARAKKLYGERDFYSAAPIEDAGKYQQALYQLAPLSEAANKAFEELKNIKYPDKPTEAYPEPMSDSDTPEVKQQKDAVFKVWNKYHAAREKVRNEMMDKHQAALEATAKIKAKIQEMENLIHRSTFPVVESVPLFIEDHFKPSMYLGILCPEFRYF